MLSINVIECYRIGVDEWLRVPSVEDVFAVGDCAGFLEQTGRPVLPALAQVRFFFTFCKFSFSSSLSLFALWNCIFHLKTCP
jgi:hypothetical protein